jgi:hypothetical protein
MVIARACSVAAIAARRAGPVSGRILEARPRPLQDVNEALCAARRRLRSAGAKSGRGDVKRTTRCELAKEGPDGVVRTVFSIGLNAVYAPGQSRATRETGAKKPERYGRPEGEPTQAHADPSLAQPWQRGRLQRPAAVLRQPLLSCFSVVAHRAGARVRDAALPHRFSAAHTLAWPSRVCSFSLTHTLKHRHTRAAAVALPAPPRRTAVSAKPSLAGRKGRKSTPQR